MLPPAVNSSGALKFPCNGARGIPPPLSFRRSAAEPRNLSSNGTRRNEAGDLGAQSLNSTDTSLAIPACSPARDDRAAGSARGNTFPPYTRHPERQRRISVNTISEGKGSQYQWAGRRVPGPGMTCSRVIIGKYRDSSTAAQNDRRGRKEDFRRAYHAKKTVNFFQIHRFFMWISMTLYFSRFRSMAGAAGAGFSSGRPCSRMCMNWSPVMVSFS